MPEWIEDEQIAQLKAWRAARNAEAVAATLSELRAAAQQGRNIMEPSIACAKAGVTTGEWGETLRRVFGEYRAPTGVAKVRAETSAGIEQIRADVDRVSAKLGRRVKFLVGKPGLDGHSNGAEQIAVRARDCGMEVVYEGIRLTPAEIVNAALEEGVHVVGLSILSGSHVPLARDIVERMRAAGLDTDSGCHRRYYSARGRTGAESERHRRRVHAKRFSNQRDNGGDHTPYRS